MRPYSPALNRVKDFYRYGGAFTNTIALSGGNTTGSFRTSYSNQDALGISPKNDYHKKIFNAGLNQKICNKMSMTLNVNYTNDINNNPPQVGVQGVGSPNFLYRMAGSIGLESKKC